MKVKKGNLLDAFDDGADVIFHVANCQTTMQSGVALALKEKWPQVYEADKKYLTKSPSDRLGNISRAVISPGQVVNLYGQLNYGRGERHLNYEAFYKGLEEIKCYMLLQEYNKLACAYKTGADRAGGNWEILEKMIDVVFGGKIEVVAYKL